MKSNENQLPPKERIKKGKANAIDVYVGKRLRLRRMLLGLSQEKVAEAVGLTFQQVQKYERGSNRIGAGRLYEFSRALCVPIQYFFETEEGGGALNPAALGLAEGAEPFAQSIMHPSLNKETSELLRAYYKIPDQKVRRRLFDLAKTLGDAIATLTADKKV